MVVIPSAGYCMNSYRLMWPTVASAVISRGKQASNTPAEVFAARPQ